MYEYNDLKIPILYNVDTAVIGGGTSGVSCAYICSKKSKVLVIEKNLSLGGTQTNALVTPMMPSYVKHNNFHNDLVSNLEKETNCVLKHEKNSKTIWFDPITLENVVENMLVSNNVQILYNANVVDAILKNGEIVILIVQAFNKTFGVKANCFVDASGDAWLARLCNIETSSGNNGEFSSLSLRFEIGNVKIKKLKKWCLNQKYEFFDPSKYEDFFEFVHIFNNPLIGNISKIFKNGILENLIFEEDVKYIQAFTMPGKKDVLSFNNPQIPNKYIPTDPKSCSNAVIWAHKSQQRLMNFLQKKVPGFEKAYIIKRANLLGIRESYRIIGKYILTSEDYLKRKKFNDGVARGDWYIDVHSDLKKYENVQAKYEKNEYYEIPYRCLITNEVSNYIAIGRHVSADFLAQSSLRIQVTCQDMGEAAGIACIYSKQENVKLNQIDGKIIKKLLEQNSK